MAGFRFAGSLAIAFFLAGVVSAQELPRGQVIDRVEIAGSDRQSYALYVPSNYSAGRTWPILYCLDPGARGRVPVDRFSAAAEKAGFLVAGSNNSRNGPLEPSELAIRMMLADTHSRFRIDDSHVYAAGLSGGARLALAWARNGQLAGVVASSAGFGTPTLPKQIPFLIFATAGVDDFNHDELYRMSRELARRRTPHRFEEFEGGHEWLPATLADEALQFFLGKVPAQAATPSKEQEKLAARFDRLMQDLASAGDGEKAILIRSLQKDSARSEDNGDRRVARRVLGGLSIETIERGRDLMGKGEYAAAAKLYETGVLLRPENDNSWYSLAVAQAGAGNTRRAIEALEQAIERGFKDAARIEQESLFARLQKEQRYGEMLRKLKNP
ncbi:MAG TPA: tetratricopeptide repeat protein [Bryobacteraceae bacterium]|nr:tetratricopeptide repeat protein [Bryobacteraceae bacterium]